VHNIVVILVCAENLPDQTVDILSEQIVQQRCTARIAPPDCPKGRALVTEPPPTVQGALGCRSRFVLPLHA
jgi:hypothetical protein